jgi:hypothetical protein
MLTVNRVGVLSSRAVLLWCSCAIGVMACTATVALRAQTPAPPGSQPNPSNARRFVVIGCVSRETQGSTAANPRAATGPRFIVTDTRSDPVSIYRLDGDEATLNFHVGHTVEIAGPLSSLLSSLLSAGPGDPGEAAPAPKVLKVESLTYLATTCQKMKRD